MSQTAYLMTANSVTYLPSMTDGLITVTKEGVVTIADGVTEADLTAERLGNFSGVALALFRAARTVGND